MSGDALSSYCAGQQFDAQLCGACPHVRRCAPTAPADHPEEECGVFGIWDPGKDVARLTYFALQALQHRGQESAGIAVGNGASVLAYKDEGLASHVFDDASIAALTGNLAIGHVRYGTSGGKDWRGAQPHLATIGDVVVALAHNGTLVNSDALRRQLIDLGIPFLSNTDSEVATCLIGYFTQRTHHLRKGIQKAMELIEGAYAMVLINEESLYAFRDPNGIRPLVLGQLADGGWCVASETCAFDIVGATFVRDIRPGEVLRINAEGLTSDQAVPPRERALCIFEHVYFARPDSVMEGDSIYEARSRMGERLAAEAPVDADYVIGVPDSGLPAAEGFARASGIPFSTGFVRNRYIARTFIQPAQEMREMGVRIKLNPLKAVVEGKRLIVVDDSIVRGTTSRQLVKILRDAGATEVHMRIVSPEVKWPCFYGLDTDVQKQLISANKNVHEVCEWIDADSLAFLSLDGLLSCVQPGGYCCACFDGCYPVEIPAEFSYGKFLDGFSPNNLNPSPLASHRPVSEIVSEIEKESAQ